jgi:hypothetical protein
VRGVGLVAGDTGGRSVGTGLWGIVRLVYCTVGFAAW